MKGGPNVLEVTLGGTQLNTFSGVGEFRILPTTKRILLRGSAGLQMAPCTGGLVGAPTTLDSGVASINGVSPDENYVAYVQSTPTVALKVVPVVGGVAATLDTAMSYGTVVLARNTFNVFYLRNDIAYTECDDEGYCWTAYAPTLYQRDRFANTARTTIGAVTFGTVPVLSPADDKLAYPTAAGALVVRTLATGVAATLTTEPLSWLPSVSGDKILFSVAGTTGYDVKSFNFTDSVTATHTNCPVSTFTPTASGRLLCAGSFGATLSGATAGGTPIQLVASSVANAQLSPDGTHLLLRTTGTDPSTYRTRISDGATTRLVSGAGEAVIGAGNSVATYKSTAATGFDFQKGIYVSTAP